MNILIAVQPNGERIRIERWIYVGYLHGTVIDPFLINPIRWAKRLYWN